MYREIPPPPDLRSLVACYWASSGPRPSHRVLPDGCIDVLLVVNDVDGDTAERGVRVVGTMTTAIVSPAGEGAALGVRFRPGEAARILPEAPRELTDADADLDAVWTHAAGRHAEERLLVSLARTRGDVLERAAPSFDRMLRARLASHAGAVDLHVREAVAKLTGGASVQATAAHVGLSERQFGRRFTGRVGIGPKAFARVMRLQRAAAALADGASIAQASDLAGYADQAHFTREANELAGASPRTLQLERRPPSGT